MESKFQKEQFTKAMVKNSYLPIFFMDLYHSVIFKQSICKPKVAEMYGNIKLLVPPKQFIMLYEVTELILNITNQYNKVTTQV